MQKKLAVSSWQLAVKTKIQNLFKTATCSLRTAHSQEGLGQLALVLVMLAGLAVGTYLVQNQSQLFSRAASSDKATIKDRSESTGSDGIKQIKFTWSDGRVSYDFKDASGNLLKGRSYAMRGNERSSPTGEQAQGTTFITNWSDGTVEYNVFTDGKYDQSKSYAVSGTASARSPKPSTSSKSTSPKEKNSQSTSTRPQTTTQTTSPRPTTSTTTSTAITQNPQTAVSNTTSQVTPSVDPGAILTQFQTLKQTYETSILAKINAPTTTLTPQSKQLLDPMIAKANQSIEAGIRAVGNCQASPSASCSNALPPLLNYARVAVRLVAFGAIFVGIPEICTRADFGIEPPITGTATNNVTGPIYLCSGSNGQEKKWRIFDAGNLPLTLSPTDAAIWKPLVNPTTNAEYPQPFFDKFNQANNLVNSLTPNTVVP